jgi:hypothetical protein
VFYSRVLIQVGTRANVRVRIRSYGMEKIKDGKKKVFAQVMNNVDFLMS